MQSGRRALVHGQKGVYEMLIGLEIHAQILCESKLFSRSPSSISSDVSPNSCVSLFDVAIPGTLPQLGRVPVEQALRAALALKCNINKTSKFERKHYFYQDMPLGYQITQQEIPIAENGTLTYEINTNGQSPIRDHLTVQRIQIEQDSGKSIHDMHPTFSLVDLNRAGSALIEMVFLPTLRSPTDAAAAIRTLQQLLRHIGVCDGNMENGSLRCDVNISVMKSIESNDTQIIHEQIKGERVEIKNVSSIQRVIQAIEFESKRQVERLEAGEVVKRETRGYDATTGKTFYLRDKETAVDYRFFPDPDLPLLCVTDEDIEHIRNTFPELPDETINRIKVQYSLDDYQVNVLMSQQGIQYYEMVVSLTSEYDKISIFNWITSDLLGLLNILNSSFKESPISPQQMAQCIHLLRDSIISAPQCKQLLKILFDEEKGGDPEAIVIKKGWKQITNNDTIQNIVIEVINDSKFSEQLNKFKSGKSNMDKFFFGEIMRRSKGQASPHVVQDVLRIELAKIIPK
eukprot:gene961-1862_t